MSFDTVSIKRFRETVENIKDSKAKNMMKLGYLLANRNCELLTKTSPLELLNHHSKPYGVFSKSRFEDYRMVSTDPEGKVKVTIEKALLITLAVAKRGKRIKKKAKPEKEQKPLPQVKPEEIEQALTKFHQTKLLEKWKKGEVQIDPLLVHALLGNITFKTVALPTSIKYEPWTLDILQYWREHGSYSIDMTRKTFWKTYRESIAELLPKKSPHSSKNPLRHFRISHLISLYGFEPYELSAYAGWTIRGSFQSVGIDVSPNVDHYAHLAWHQYFKKLLVPLADVL